VCIRQFVCDTHSKKRKPTNERSPHRTRLTATPRPGGGSASLRRRRRGIGIRERERSGMAGDRMSWARLLKWSLSYMDGARPSRDIRWGEGKWRLVISSAVFIWVAAEASLWCAVLCSEEERRWLAEAVERHMAEDVVGRLREIALLMRTPLSVLEAQGITPEDIEDLLAELQVHVESIDIANDLHSVGGLVPVIRYLRNTNARIRAKAADVVTTVVQNNPTSQQLVMEASGFEPLVSNFTSDPDLTARIKALGALSSLIRNNKPGVAAFRLANGYAGLRDALNSESARFQRKALSLTHYLLSESHSDCSVFAQLGFPRLMMRLVSSDDSGVREAALGGLLELAKDTTLGNRSLLADQDRLRRLLWGRIQSIRMMAPEDLDAAREERQLVDSLWIACYHEPSTLNREGLVVLPGEESFEQPPDVAGRFFEPLRRAPLQRAAPSPDERSDPGNGTLGGIMLLLGPAPGNSE
uniref:Nucleotide exchange factor Fes1 domain-containing protein n=2 Tax=Aegilops tauschii subsp. strangulata TaxID=200361 RepID=A0A453IE95_AEGTS